MLVLVAWSTRMNIRTLQTIIHFFEKDHRIFLILPNPLLWVPFLMYLYPYRSVSLLPGPFLGARGRKILVTDGVAPGNHVKRLRLVKQYDSTKVFIPYIRNPDYCWLYPFDVNPLGKDRPGLVFFAGNVNPQFYGSQRFEKHYQMPNRLSVYRILCDQQNAVQGVWFDEKKPDHRGRLFIHTLGETSLNAKRYTQYLAQFRFVICAPGVSMPLCHNLIEAMEAGCVPIFSYPEWLPPGLTNGVNCLVYKTTDDLVNLLHQLPEISSDAWRQMQIRLVDYLRYKYLSMADNWRDVSELYVINEEKDMFR